MINKCSPLAKQVSFHWPNQLAGVPGTLRNRNTSNECGRDPIELAHYQTCCSGELVRQSNDGCLQNVSFCISLATIIKQGRHSCDADGDIDQAFAPRAAEGIGNDDCSAHAEGTREPLMKSLS